MDLKKLLINYFQRLDYLLEKEENIQFPSLEKRGLNSRFKFLAEVDGLCDEQFFNSPEYKIKNTELKNSLLYIF